MKDGKIFFTLVSAFLKESVIYARFNKIISPILSNKNDYWMKCDDLCREMGLKSVVVNDIVKCVESGESAFVMSMIAQLSHICEELKINDVFWMIHNKNQNDDINISDMSSDGIIVIDKNGDNDNCKAECDDKMTVKVVKNPPDVTSLPLVNHFNSDDNGKNGDKNLNVCAVCGRDTTFSKRASRIGEGRFPLKIGVSFPWSKVICYGCYQKNRKYCIHESASTKKDVPKSGDDENESVKTVFVATESNDNSGDEKYVCECGTKFDTPQKKASHCRSCEFHKKKRPRFFDKKKSTPPLEKKIKIEQINIVDN